MWPANFNKILVQMLHLEWCRATCGERWKDKHNMINVTLVLDLLICCGGGSNVGGGTDTNDCWNNAYSCWTYKINDMLGNNQENQVSPLMIFYRTTLCWVLWLHLPFWIFHHPPILGKLLHSNLSTRLLQECSRNVWYKEYDCLDIHEHLFHTTYRSKFS